MSTTISPSAPETVQEDKPKKERNRKPLFELPEGVKVDATPEGFDYEKHRMTPGQFTDRPCYMEHQALIYERKAVKLREAAVEYRANPPVKAGAQKRAKLVARLSKLEEKLKELGVNVEDLFGDDEE